MYIKEKIGNLSVQIEIKNDNVYFSCDGCGDEIKANFDEYAREVISLDIPGFIESPVYCDECRALYSKLLRQKLEELKEKKKMEM